MDKGRLHAIDALRAFAMISVVFLHASISYMTVRMPDLLWAVHDPKAVPFFDWFFFWIHGLTMRIFFLVAGFFAVMLYEKRGSSGFLENRRRRILIPFLVGCGVLLPLIYLVWCYGLIQTGQGDLSQALHLKFSPDVQRDLYGPAHLWFLEFLLIFYAVFFVARKFNLALRAPSRWIETLLFSPLRPLLLAIPCTLILRWDMAAAVNFHNSFIPNPWKLLYYGVFFLTGAWLYRWKARLEEYTALAWTYLLISLPIFALMGLLLKQHLAVPLSGMKLWALAAAISCFAWFSVFGLLGVFLRFFKHEKPLVRYLSNASYWVYLSHLPVVGVLQVFFLTYDWPAAVKFSAAIVTTFAFSFLSYEWLVRRTLIGACLNGAETERGYALKPFKKNTKIALSLGVAFLVLIGGVSFQKFYNSEKKRYEEIITGYYRKYFNREPDPVGLRHWTNWAMNRWNLEKVEEEGFRRVSLRGE